MRTLKACLAPVWATLLCLTPMIGRADTPKAKAASTKGPAATPVTADALFEDYTPDFTQGQDKWLGKTVEVSGFCLSRDPENLVISMVDPWFGIICRFPKTATKQIAGLTIGQCVKAVGKIGYFSSGHVEIACSSMTLCDTKAMPVPADFIYDEIKSDPKGAVERYKKRAIFIHGTLSSVVVQTGGVQKTIIGLQTKDGEKVWCFIQSSTDDSLAKLAEGTGMNIWGKVESYSRLNGQLRVKVNVFSYTPDSN